MASISPTRPSRRAAARKQVIVDEDSEDDFAQQSTVKEEEDDFTPAPERSSPKRSTRRKTTTEIPQTPRTAARTRKPRVTEGIEPSQIFAPEETPLPMSPTKKASPRKRQSTAAPKRSRASVVPTAPGIMTPRASVAPEALQAHAGPLTDVTSSKVNEQAQVVDEQMQKAPLRIKPLDTVLERPMDIVVRTRALGVPQSKEPIGNKPRTVIKYLVLNNFKSYAGRQEVGPFHASFSSVVGPNGSGKSNVIDSLLFVFGFRASKMRQGKISALIHNSAGFPDLDFCEVEVHFEEIMDLPGGKHEIVPDSTLIVSRKAFKNNSSKYYINTRESNFTAVTTLLKSKGIDLDHKRFLILQGEVESIAQMKPKAANEHDDGLLEYLEDIIGTSKYKSLIEESAAKVEAFNEICVEKNARVQHVEKEKNSLEDKKNTALAYIRDENELTYQQAALYQVYINDCEDNLKVTEEAIAQLQAELDEELGKHKGNEDDIKQLEKSYKHGLKDYQALEASTQAVLKELAKYEKEKVKFEEKKKFLQGKQKKLEKAALASRLSASEATSLIEKHSDDIERNTSEIAVLEEKRKKEEVELANIRESLKGKTQEFSDQIAVKQRAMEPWNEKINQKQSEIAVAQSELEILKERASSGEVALEEAQKKVSAIQETQKAKHAELKDLISQKSQLEADVQRVQKELAKLARKQPELRSHLSGARQKADEARASLSKSQSQSAVLSGLMRLKESGRIVGFHGRLGNLGIIDQKYDVAISTACPSLDNLVVDTVEVGQQCIDYLRKNNLGRANIILLDRLARRDMSPLDTPENVPRLFDLVKSKDERFKPAFYSVLQNTLVAKDLEQANRIAYGARRWRVVTLDGHLIDVSGTMSGGGTRVAKGGMSSKLASETTREQVQKLDVERDALEQELQGLQQKQAELEGQLKALSNQIPESETTIEKMSLELDSSSRNLADAQRRVQELTSQQPASKSDEAQIKALEKQIGKLEQELAKLHSQSAGLEQEIKYLQDKIMEVGGVRLRSQRTKVEGLKEQIDTLAEEMSNAEVAKSKASKDKTKQEKAHAQAQKEAQAVEAEMAELENEAQTQLSEASVSKQKATEAQDALETKKEELDAVKQDLEQKTALLNETRAVEIEMKNKLEESNKISAENSKRHHYWSEKFNKLSILPLSDLGEEQEAAEIPTYTKDELQDMNKDTLKAEIAVLEEKIQNVNVDLAVLEEYRRRVEEHNARSGDLLAAVTERDTARKSCDDLRKLRLEGFMEGFSIISLRLKEMYQMITMGGNAELELVDSLDPFSEGILFSVMPPKKSWKNISNLSGGEKTLSSLALVFALQIYSPTPLYVMDEIDAALDFRNVSIIASYIKERTRNAQFIVISLRNNMFELASRLVGVYKVNHMTKSITIENKDYISRPIPAA